MLNSRIRYLLLCALAAWLSVPGTNVRADTDEVIAAANKLVGETLDDRKQRALLDEFFSGVRSGKLVFLDGSDFRGESAQVTSALPLNKEEEDAVRRDVLAKAGAKEVHFRVDPSILGGLVIRVGDKVLDTSVAGKLEGLRQSLR